MEVERQTTLYVQIREGPSLRGIVSIILLVFTNTAYLDWVWIYTNATVENIVSFSKNNNKSGTFAAISLIE